MSDPETKWLTGSNARYDGGWFRVDLRRTVWEFLEHLLEAMSYRTHTILADNGVQFAEQPGNRNTAWSRQMRFDMNCEADDIEHRRTKPTPP